MSKRFSVLRLRDVEFKNRIFASPMCQSSSENAMPNAWHSVHLGSCVVVVGADDGRSDHRYLSRA